METTDGQLVVIVVPDGGSLFEVATPSGVWNAERWADLEPPLRFVPCAVEAEKVTLEGGVTMGELGLLADHVGNDDAADNADMIIVPTWPVADKPVTPALIELLQTAHDGGARIVGLCLGAFAVASAGLLDGRTGVTHWRYRERLEESFPLGLFHPGHAVVDHDSIITSAGSAAAVDCCLHLVRRDHMVPRWPPPSPARSSPHPIGREPNRSSPPRRRP